MVSAKVKEGNTKLTLSINKDILGKYKEFCTKGGFLISKQVEKFMRSQLKNKSIWENLFKK